MFKILPKHLFIGIVLFFPLSGLTAWHVHAAIPAAERAALIALYNSTDGDNRTNNSGWKAPPLDVDGLAMPGTENTWFGVTTDAGNTTVTSIGLGRNQLSGSIPSELGNLLNLEGILLEFYQLTGTIPIQLGSLTNLINLDLQGNQLAGSIPAELGNLINLATFSINSNMLIGAIPMSLINLSGLSNTDIGYDALYTNNVTLGTFLSGEDPDWGDTQTVAPENVSASTTLDNSIEVSWTPILYTADSGGYQVFYSTSSGGPYTASGTTIDKSASQVEVTRLSPGTTYFSL